MSVLRPGLALPCVMVRVRDPRTIDVIPVGGKRKLTIYLKGVASQEDIDPDKAREVVSDILTDADSLVAWIAPPRAPMNIIRDLMAFDRFLGDIWLERFEGSTWLSALLMRTGLAVPEDREPEAS